MGWFKRSYEAAEHVHFGHTAIEWFLDVIGLRSWKQFVVNVLTGLLASGVAWLRQLDALIIVVIGLAVFLIVGVAMQQFGGRRKSTAPHDENSDEEFMSTKGAIVFGNDKLHETPNARYLDEWMEGYSGDDQRIEAAVRMLSSSAPLYGKSAFKSIRQKIELNTLEHDLLTDIVSGGTIARQPRTGKTLFTDLAFRRSDIEGLVNGLLVGK